MQTILLIALCSFFSPHTLTLQPTQSNRLVQIETKLSTPKTLQATFNSISTSDGTKNTTASQRGVCPTIPVALTDEDCTAVGGQWTDAQTTCDNGATCESDCSTDLNGDGMVDVVDLLQIVGEWASQDSDADIDGSGVVDTCDLLAVIATWGQCE
jgi:hypothetical protein